MKKINKIAALTSDSELRSELSKAANTIGCDLVTLNSINEVSEVLGSEDIDIAFIDETHMASIGIGLSKIKKALWVYIAQENEKLAPFIKNNKDIKLIINRPIRILEELPKFLSLVN